MRTRVLMGFAFLVALGVGGCAELKDVFSPSPPQLPPARKEAIPPSPSTPPPPPPASQAPAPAPPQPQEQPPAAAPPAVLSPRVGRADEDRLRHESATRIQKAEEIIKQIDQNKLTKDQLDTLSTIQSFLTNAKEALGAQDFVRASNLAAKAQILAEELFRKPQ